MPAAVTTTTPAYDGSPAVTTTTADDELRQAAGPQGDDEFAPTQVAAPSANEVEPVAGGPVLFSTEGTGEFDPAYFHNPWAELAEVYPGLTGADFLPVIVDVPSSTPQLEQQLSQLYLDLLDATSTYNLIVFDYNSSVAAAAHASTLAANADSDVEKYRGAVFRASALLAVDETIRRTMVANAEIIREIKKQSAAALAQGDFVLAGNLTDARQLATGFQHGLKHLRDKAWGYYQEDKQVINALGPTLIQNNQLGDLPPPSSFPIIRPIDTTEYFP